MEAKIKGIIAGVITFWVFLMMVYIGVCLDLLFNSWIRELQGLQWWNFFTKHHYIAWLFANSQWSWLIPASIISLIAGLLMGIYVYVYLSEK